jgi:hypothetical protein
LNLKPEQHLEYYYDILFKLNEANQQASANGKGEEGKQGNDQVDQPFSKWTW